MESWSQELVGERQSNVYAALAPNDNTNAPVEQMYLINWLQSKKKKTGVWRGVWEQRLVALHVCNWNTLETVHVRRQSRRID